MTMEERITDALRSEGLEVDVGRRLTLKANSQYEAFTIRETTANAGVSLPVTSFEEDFGSAILQTKTSLTMMMPEFDLDLFTDYEKIRGKVHLQLINTEKNNKFLEDVVSRELLDLSLIVRILINELTDETIMSTVVTKSMLHALGVTEEELFRDAYSNSQKHTIYPITSIPVMAGFISEEDLPMLEMYCPVFVGMSDTRCFGASCIATEDFLEEAHSRLGDFYILPSSVFEVIMIPAALCDSVEDLKAMVADVNRESVPEEDFLSDSVYFYSKDTGLTYAKNRKLDSRSGRI